MSYGDTDREYATFADDGCLGCGKPRMHRSYFCLDCASADEVGPDLTDAFHADQARAAEWRHTHHSETEHLIFDVYEGPTIYPEES
jgi:hypothetical protein